MSGAADKDRERLLERIEMLEKINRALMDRVERSVDSAGDAYALFENNIIMQGLIADRTRELEQANAALMDEIAIRRAAEGELRLAKEQAEAASRAKSEFLANMSHEIRTPMTAILGYADLAIEERDDPAARARHLGVIKRSGEHLLCIINDILDLSKLDAGEMSAARDEVCPEQLCRGVVDMLRVQADSKGLDLRFEYDGAAPGAVISDAIRLRQILLNLVGNAVKFTDKGSVTVRLSYDAHTAAAIVRVEDTGVGIKGHDLEQIFMPFHQADSSATRRHGGTGLGLAIARRFARLLGGDIAVESRPGHGSVFTLTFHAEAPAARPEPGETLEAAARPAGAWGSGGRALEGRRILLAEDGPDNRRLISFLLGKAGAEVLAAEHGRAAVELVLGAGGVAPELILMDMQMPEMDGYAATRALRGAGVRTPVIALTAHAMQGDRERCLEAGCDEYLTKPINRDELIAACVRFLGVRPGVRMSA
ncbi:MAG: response regulator [Phycisphaerales bacterium]|nr:response regulator [Planctomycetota bacterium]MCH8509925.1 response regulator [Phycisphaerales bacterium]